MKLIYRFSGTIEWEYTIPNSDAATVKKLLASGDKGGLANHLRHNGYRKAETVQVDDLASIRTVEVQTTHSLSSACDTFG